MCIGQTTPTELSGNPEVPLSHLYDMLLAPYLCHPLLSLGGKLDSSLHLWASLLMSLGRCCCVALGTMGTVKLVLYTVYFSWHLPGPVLSAPPAVSSKTYCLSLSDGPCQEWSRELWCWASFSFPICPSSRTLPQANCSLRCSALPTPPVKWVQYTCHSQDCYKTCRIWPRAFSSRATLP